MSESVERFSSRVENYAKYRPGYPVAIVELLRGNCGLTSDSVIADIGAGTGKLSEIFLQNGNQVFAVEPNASMRTASEAIFASQPRFVSIDGTAEQTGLRGETIDFITAGQAFHWFNYEKFKVECLRILKPKGWVILVWNVRRLDATPFLRDFEAFLLRYGTDYETVRHENALGDIERFFGPRPVNHTSFPTFQNFDLEGLRGRVFSSSYTPQGSHPVFQSMVESLEGLFWRYQQAGEVVVEYDTQVFYGQLGDQADTA